jgi:hypothetical protein
MASKQFKVPINLVNLTSDPSGSIEGDIYWNSSDNKLRVYYDGAWYDAAPAGGGTASDSFKTIAVTGQSSVVADSSTDTLNLVAGTNVSITTDSTTDSITINSTGAYTSVDSITYPDYITFDTTPETIPTAAGSLFWDSGDGLPKAILNANVELGIGQEQVALVKNATGSTIAKGKVVYINGAAGQRPTIALSDADTEATSSKTLGITAESISNGAEGFVATFGVLRGVNTNGLTEGAAVWLSSTAGSYTTTIPAEPAHSVFLGYVVKAHATAGEIFVNIQNGYELTELHGVVIDGTPADNEVLAYDTTSGLWINQTPTESNLATRNGWTHDSGIIIQSSSGSVGSLSLKSFSSTIDILDTSVNIISGVDAKTWNFQNDGDLVFPDTTVQNTAFLGMSGYTTTNLSEGTNLYFTDERAQDAVGNSVGTGISYNDGTGAISNSGVLDLTGTTNEIVVSASTGSITIGIPDSPVLVTPNIGVATATSVNGTTIPSSKTLVVTTDIGSSVQGYSTTLAGINTLGSGTGFLKNTAGTWSYDNSTYLTTASASSSYQPLDTELTALASTTSSANALPYFTGSGTATTTTLSSFGRSLIDDTDASASRTTLGLGTMATETASNYLTTTSASSTYAPLAGATFTGNIAVNNGTSTAITTTGTTAKVFNTGATTIEIGHAATTISIGSIAHTGTTTINNDLAVYGSITFSAGSSSLSATTIQIDDTLISLADNNTADILDIGFFAGYRQASTDYHTGLVRDASDSGIWKLFSGITAQPTGTVDFTGATFDILKIGSLQVSDASTTRSNLGLAIGTNVQAYNSTLAAVAGGTYTGDDSITTVGTIATGVWQGTAITDAYINGALTILNGTINSTPIGATTASTGKFTSVDIDGEVLIDTFTGIGNAAAQNIDTAIDETIYTGAEYLVSVKTSTGRYLSKVLLICDGTNAVTITEYGILTIGTAPAVTIAAGGSISAPQLSVNAPTSSNITLVRTLVVF